MVTTKKATRVTVKQALKFHPEWFTDPGPEIAKLLKPSAVRELERAKKEFATRVNEILAKGQK